MLWRAAHDACPRWESRESKKQSLKHVQKIYEKVVSLKNRFTFRVISDDANMQLIYNDMYEILEIESLLKDLDESGEKLNEVLQRDQEAREGRLEPIFIALSLLAASSAFIDLTDFLEKFNSGNVTWPTIVGLVVNMMIIVVAVVFIVVKVIRNKRGK